MPNNEYSGNHAAEVKRCAEEIARAAEAIRTGVSPDTGKDISVHEAILWHTGWSEEAKLIQKERAAKREIGVGA
jgi:hypothetical protein